MPKFGLAMPQLPGPDEESWAYQYTESRIGARVETSEPFPLANAADLTASGSSIPI